MSINIVAAGCVALFAVEFESTNRHVASFEATAVAMPEPL
jgi:hypothetical protein